MPWTDCVVICIDFSFNKNKFERFFFITKIPHRHFFGLEIYKWNSFHGADIESQDQFD